MIIYIVSHIEIKIISSRRRAGWYDSAPEHSPVFLDVR